MKSFIHYIKTILQDKKNESEWQLGYVTIGVHDLKQMKRFYTKNLGLSVLQSYQHSILLGSAIGSVPMIKLVQIAPPYQQKVLYYIGLKLPKKEYLGDLANHLLAENCLILASEDDGYSEAFYIKDPENNRIKIYWDKPSIDVQLNFDHQEADDLHLPINHLLTIRDNPYDELPRNSRLAQVHLSVKDNLIQEEFFTEILPFETTYDYVMKRRNFKMNHDYYSIATNEWNRTHLMKRRPTDLLEIMLYSPNFRALEAIVKKLEAENIDYTLENSELVFSTPSHIQLCIKVRE
ncbi:Catechol-2,3-dioxygenase [Granulicatella balaenopterae]|uniref:Catechol-2,3-dioxygenase n=1 Tax=Granulicatella balaenopterae TaxID=137733 RepID=A0A1H9NPT9_9LACT|nr:VOC family protein [Granulicatella balaenopterae]SER37665.1 Catechol-2,3-dioxygenase [Granulicatella balaenopterae]